MDRRGFLKFLGAGVAGIALEQAIPFGRVWSFPSKIALGGDLVDTYKVTAVGNQFLNVEWVTKETLEQLKRNLKLSEHLTGGIIEGAFTKSFAVGDVISIRSPQRFTLAGRRQRLP